MYVPTSILQKDQDIVCMYTGEAYTYITEEEKSSLSADQLQHVIDILPERFHKHPRVFKGPNGDIRVYGIKT